MTELNKSDNRRFVYFVAFIALFIALMILYQSLNDWYRSQIQDGKMEKFAIPLVHWLLNKLPFDFPYNPLITALGVISSLITTGTAVVPTLNNLTSKVDCGTHLTSDDIFNFKFLLVVWTLLLSVTTIIVVFGGTKNFNPPLESIAVGFSCYIVSYYASVVAPEIADKRKSKTEVANELSSQLINQIDSFKKRKKKQQQCNNEIKNGDDNE